MYALFKARATSYALASVVCRCDIPEIDFARYQRMLDGARGIDKSVPRSISKPTRVMICSTILADRCSYNLLCVDPKFLTNSNPNCFNSLTYIKTRHAVGSTGFIVQTFENEKFHPGTSTKWTKLHPYTISLTRGMLSKIVCMWWFLNSLLAIASSEFRFLPEKRIFCIPKPLLHQLRFYFVFDSIFFLFGVLTNDSNRMISLENTLCLVKLVSMSIERTIPWTEAVRLTRYWSSTCHTDKKIVCT